MLTRIRVHLTAFSIGWLATACALYLVFAALNAWSAKLFPATMPFGTAMTIAFAFMAVIYIEAGLREFVRAKLRRR